LSILFEPDSRLAKIGSSAFSCSSLQSIIIPCSVKVLESWCLSFLNLLSSISFESNSRVTRFEDRTFSFSTFEWTEIKAGSFFLKQFFKIIIRMIISS
jgi:hypothetical protein